MVWAILFRSEKGSVDGHLVSRQGGGHQIGGPVAALQLLQGLADPFGTLPFAARAVFARYRYAAEVDHLDGAEGAAQPHPLDGFAPQIYSYRKL